MATKLDELKWKQYLKKRKKLYIYGAKNGLIHDYEQELIENLRHVYYGGIPASILLLCNRACNGYCYDRALLICHGFEDDEFKIVDADIDGIALNPIIIDKYNKAIENGNSWNHYANHCFVERTKKDGTTWVYDTSIGLVFEKNLYYELQNPIITKINDKQATLDYFEYQDVKNADIEKDKYVIPLILPNIEAAAEYDDDWYSQALKEEIKRFKKEINYDAIVKEIEEDMKRKGLYFKNKI